jgi:hypothetical protein
LGFLTSSFELFELFEFVVLVCCILSFIDILGFCKDDDELDPFTVLDGLTKDGLTIGTVLERGMGVKS